MSKGRGRATEATAPSRGNPTPLTQWGQNIFEANYIFTNILALILFFLHVTPNLRIVMCGVTTEKKIIPGPGPTLTHAYVIYATVKSRVLTHLIKKHMMAF